MSATTESGLPATAIGPRPHSPLTVLVPTYNEAENVRPLLSALEAALDGLPAARVLFVDDSSDGTDELIRELAPTLGIEVGVLHRAEPAGGLGGAVVAGLAAAETPWCVVMDADLQHPPELAPALVAEGERTGAQLVVGSRYRAGHRAEGFTGPVRSLVSRLCTRLVRLAFPRTLAGITDPMSGLFAIRRDLWERAELRPEGYKILLELAVRTRPTVVAELPYRFRPRHSGESKAGYAEGVRFLRHLIRLRLSGPRGRMLGFLLIGASGTVPNLLATWLLIRLGVHYLLAAIVANQAAMLWNFLLIDLALFHHRRTGRPAWRLARFALLANADLVGRIPLLSLLVHDTRLGPIWASGVTLLAACAVRFVIADRVLYLPAKAEASSS
ncbi:glycosyltransferase [Actinospica durhamensis]|uniref:Glycosyltransferase n=1 Tax=Actinospica durhamensis TaxID=1508375 RepID=A0A941EZZ2_9ACTN|nr:glycosyltransferase [Actinospica durhamensis]MBR7837544.1 glycosyltransferase [Actinospica durhamensis]